MVGGGPAGLLASRVLAESGVEVLILEEDWEIGVPEHCAGLFGLGGLRGLGVSLRRDFVQNRVRGAVMRSPSGVEVEVDARGDVAVVASRAVFDKMLAEEAEKRGALIQVGRRVSEIVREGEMVVVKSRDGVRVEAKRVLDCEGMPGILARRTIGKASEKKGWIPIIQLLVEGHGLDPRYVYLYFEEYLPEFFGYLIPIDGQTGKLGIASRKNLKTKLNKFLSEHFPRVKILGGTSHAVYTGRPLRIDAHWEVIPLGDAAGHVKATTGGGVVMGGMIALETAKAVSSQLLGNPSNQPLKKMRTLIGELERIALTARLFRRIHPKHLDRIFRAVNDSGLNVEISRRGDMDLQATGLSRLLGSPGTLLRFFLNLVFQ